MRFPVVYRRLSALVMRLQPRSRLRQALLGRSVASSFPAFNRGDFERVLVAFASDIEYVAPAGIQALGMPGTIRGRDALGRAYADTFEDWGRWDMAPAWVLDLGNVLVVLTAISLRGRGSGVELESEWASLYEMHGGLVGRQQDFLSWEEALRAAKVDQNELPATLRTVARTRSPLDVEIGAPRSSHR
ncbi:MAG: SnoaL-like domain [Thermoleophilaceae bacterium]|nr:SnoaL-like domain [Thermoleophilaceae bacterium]